jgi:hypothetical protein
MTSTAEEDAQRAFFKSLEAPLPTEISFKTRSLMGQEDWQLSDPFLEAFFRLPKGKRTHVASAMNLLAKNLTNTLKFLNKDATAFKIRHDRLLYDGESGQMLFENNIYEVLINFSDKYNVKLAVIFPRKNLHLRKPHDSDGIVRAIKAAAENRSVPPPAQPLPQGVVKSIAEARKEFAQSSLTKRLTASISHKLKTPYVDPSMVESEIVKRIGGRKTYRSKRLRRKTRRRLSRVNCTRPNLEEDL